MCNVCMWLYANKHLVSKYSIHMNQVPVLCIDVSCISEYCVLITTPVLTRMWPAGRMQPSRNLFADLRLPEEF